MTVVFERVPFHRLRCYKHSTPLECGYFFTFFYRHIAPLEQGHEGVHNHN